MKYKGEAFSKAGEFQSIYSYVKEYQVKGNPKLWRYMDFTKFVSLLSEEALYFAKPKTFRDPLEGSYSRWDISEMNEFMYYDGTKRDRIRKLHDFSAISCWHMNNAESAAMWDLYLKSNEGIAITTNYSSLLNSIKDLRYRVFASEVNYIDFDKDMTAANVYETLFYKRKSFSHENELRLLIIAGIIEDNNRLERIFDNEGIDYREWDKKMDELEEQSYEFSNEFGTYLKCDLNNLIDEIYISPTSPSWFVDVVNSVLMKYGLENKKVIKSDLYSDFIY